MNNITENGREKGEKTMELSKGCECFFCGVGVRSRFWGKGRSQGAKKWVRNKDGGRLPLGS